MSGEQAGLGVRDEEKSGVSQQKTSWIRIGVRGNIKQGGRTDVSTTHKAHHHLLAQLYLNLKPSRSESVHVPRLS